ncbi:hypothetical protein NliqN6_4824 [Naganishia liquefaciens]|uniref:Decapping nuclease n=1 Tax=Naganishia liquefaciens TaxID=104408 RepID=A0A8H3YHQ1_9TREE|nr:hypothetical protein NliqN6_4824 [Naganishia liquefaciens]
MANVEIPIPAVRNTGNSHLPAYQSPHLIATYSHIADRSIVHNDASMSYYKGAHVGDDLKAGYGNFVERDPLLEEHLDGLCEALLRFRQNGGRMKSGAIVTFRGMLTRLLVAAFTDRDSWEMNALAFDGNVYLEDHVTRDAKMKRQEEEKSWAQQSYFGYSFEAFATTDTKPKTGKAAADKVKKKKRPSDISVNTNVQWCCVVKGKIGNVRLYMGGEVDCVEGEWQKDMRQCVELKTNMAMESQRQRSNFERKLMKHWAQSYLLGVPRIEIGFRDAQGFLTGTETYQTSQIPRIIHQTPKAPWCAVACLQSLEELTDRLMEVLLPTDPIPQWKSDGADASNLPQPSAWRISFHPNRGLSLRNMGSSIPDATPDSISRWGFLPTAFVRQMLELDKAAAGPQV